MDPESIGKETIIRVTDWLRGMWEMRRRAGPVQQWVDSIPSPTKSNLPNPSEQQKESHDKPNISMVQTEPKDIPFSVRAKPPSMTISAPINVPDSPTVTTSGLPSSLPHNRLVRDPSFQSDSSHCSSVESLLELRRADPEAILLGLGFGGYSSSPQENGPLSRIPKRFLQPSKLRGIAINDFVRHQQETSESFDSVSLGYRGLTGSPYVAPSEIVQKIMDRLREHESHETDPYASYNCYDQYTPIQQNCTFSVLSPDNRQFLERPRSKSPDMRNKRMIIGQKSFAFGHDGDLIEIDPSDRGTMSKSSRNDQNSMHGSNISRLKAASAIENKLCKQLSFDDGIDVSDADNSLTQSPVCDTEIKIPNLNSDSDNKETVPSTTSSKGEEDSEDADGTFQPIADSRRASDGSCEVKCLNTVPQPGGRRHSDSVVHSIENSVRKSILLQRRKTLKRQQRISDADTIDYCDLTLPASGVQIQNGKESESHLSDEACTRKDNASKQSRQIGSVKSLSKNPGSISENEYCGAKIAGTHSEGTYDCVQTVEDTSFGKGWRKEKDRSSVKEKKQLRYEKRADQICKHGENSTDCRCHPNADKYWKKMDKIIQENKKLETIVAKNRREMAEIREMLSSVLSVRMEPGF